MSKGKKLSHPLSIFKSNTAMKNITFLKNIFALLLLSTLMFACEEKDKDVFPELSSKVAGSYKVTKMTNNGEEYPLELAKAVVIVQLDKFSSEVVSAKMKLTLDGDRQPDEEVGTLTLKNAGSTGIDLYEGADKVGNVKDDKMSIFVVFEGEELELTATKQ
jgi:hypothetical protein